MCRWGRVVPEARGKVSGRMYCYGQADIDREHTYCAGRQKICTYHSYGQIYRYKEGSLSEAMIDIGLKCIEHGR